MIKQTPIPTQKRAFTLIELLVVIAIISMLAAILFPVFGLAREKARLATCQSNLHQFMLGVMQYYTDNDDDMPLCVKTSDGIGQALVGTVAGINQPWGIPVEIAPYTKSQQVFQCPDDNGFNSSGAIIAGAKSAAKGGFTVPVGSAIWQAYGTSYKFNLDSFSMAPGNVTNVNAASPAAGGYPYHYYSVLDKNSNGGSNTYDKLIVPAGTACLAQTGSGGGSCTTAANHAQNPPYPLPEGFFARPSETQMFHDYQNSWSKPGNGSPDPTNLMHPTVTIMAFMDGHVKAQTSSWQNDTYCDGPTYSPIRNTDQAGYNPLGDGSCNTMGFERNTD